MALHSLHTHPYLFAPLQTNSPHPTPQKKPKVRLGLPATQWITVYNAHRPMKQRYHYNVANTRVDQVGAWAESAAGRRLGSGWV